MFTMTRQMLLIAILVMAFLGLADSWYLAQSALTNTALTCGIDSLDGCNTVAQSEYSRLFGIPLALYGVVFYGILFVLAAVALVLRAGWLARLMLGTATIGFIASLYFLYLQVFLIKALCIYCLASFVLSALLVPAAWWLLRKEPQPTAVLP